MIVADSRGRGMPRPYNTIVNNKAHSNLSFKKLHIYSVL